MGRRKAGRYFLCVSLAFVTDDFVVFFVALDGDKECARDIHMKCAESLVKAETNLCISVNNFVTCYDSFISGSSPLPSTCIGPEIPAITIQFDKVIDHFSKFLIKQYEDDSQSMCHVDTTILEGDCMAK